MSGKSPYSLNALHTIFFVRKNQGLSSLFHSTSNTIFILLLFCCNGSTTSVSRLMLPAFSFEIHILKSILWELHFRFFQDFFLLLLLDIFYWWLNCCWAQRLLLLFVSCFFCPSAIAKCNKWVNTPYGVVRGFSIAHIFRYLVHCVALSFLHTIDLYSIKYYLTTRYNVFLPQYQLNR